MNFEIDINNDLLTVPLIPPPVIRQNAYSNLHAITSFNNNQNSNQALSLDMEVNFNENIFRTIPNFDNFHNFNNLSINNLSINNLSINNLTQIKRCNSEYIQSRKSPDLKRIKTF
tara:strand:- start:4571 stop:4915 length:345 start_codon:yes stop_codon:yes gene_type:complete